MSIPFNSPSTILITGTTGSDKTTWVQNLLNHKEQLFTVPPKKVLYCYGIWQDNYDKMSGVQFHDGLPSNLDEISDGYHNIVVLDDLMDQVSSNKDMETLFTRISHHTNATVIYITQNIFYKGANSRIIALNSHYTILFKNPRASAQLKVLANQMGLNKLLPEAYKDAVREPNGYLVIDLSPHSNAEYTLRTRILPDEDPIIYQ